MNTTNTMSILAIWLVAAMAITVGCGGDDGSEGAGEATSNATSNGTTGMSNGTTSMSNGTTSMSNGTTSNGTTGTSNGTTSTSNGTTSGGAGELSMASEARACEVLVLDPAEVVQDVMFGDTVEGRFLKRGEKIAIAFHAKDDTPIEPGSVSFEIEGEAGALQLVSPRCFNTSGTLMDESGLELKR